jgi:hypothetical protein
VFGQRLAPEFEQHLIDAIARKPDRTIAYGVYADDQATARCSRATLPRLPSCTSYQLTFGSISSLLRCAKARTTLRSEPCSSGKERRTTSTKQRWTRHCGGARAAQYRARFYGARAADMHGHEFYRVDTAHVP